LLALLKPAGSGSIFRSVSLVLRISAGIVLGVVALAVLALAVLLGVGWLTYGRHASQVAAVIDRGAGCFADIGVTLANGSSRNVRSVLVGIEASLPGRSTNVLKVGDFNADFQVAAGERKSLCYDFAVQEEYGNPTPAELEWRASVLNVVFE
jgi:hypothetical protein